MKNGCFPLWESLCSLVGQDGRALFGSLQTAAFFLEVDVDDFD